MDVSEMWWACTTLVALVLALCTFVLLAAVGPDPSLKKNMGITKTVTDLGQSFEWEVGPYCFD